MWYKNVEDDDEYYVKYPIWIESRVVESSVFGRETLIVLFCTNSKKKKKTQKLVILLAIQGNPLLYTTLVYCVVR
jgi:hypothetical protein